MQTTPSHRALAEKFLFKRYWQDVIIPDSLLQLVAHAYTEEEAEIVSKLGFVAVPAWIIARRVKRPAGEVKPILQSLADRVLITRFQAGKMSLYGFLTLAPGIFETQMIRSRNTRDEYFQTFARLFEEFYREFCIWLKPRVAHKDLRFGRVISIERSLESSPGVGIIAHPTDRYSEIVDRNQSFCLVNVCACRQEKVLIGNGCGKPMDVCSGMGKLADIAIAQGLARRVSKEEFLEAKMRAAEAGLVNMVDNLEDPLQVCSCCGCCCGALRMLNQFNIPTIITQSHFEAVVNEATCKGCGTCEKWCPMNAITVEDQKAAVDYARCIGCGVCVLKCDKTKAITLRQRDNYRPPAENPFDFFVQRYLEVKGPPASLLPKFQLGLGRLLAKAPPVHLSGPRYHPPD